MAARRLRRIDGRRPSASSSRLWQQARLARVLLSCHLSLSARCDYVSAGSVVEGSMSDGGVNNSSGRQSSGRSALVAQWLSAVFTILSFCYLVFIGKQTSEINNQFRQAAPFITYPVANQIVKQFETAEGLKLFPNVESFIMITPQETGTHYLQRDEIQADVSGAWHHPVQFGETSSCGKTFDMQIIGTRLNLDQIFKDGIITKLQNDWLYSPPVTVMRERCT
jgi:hypothetical protein